MKSSKLFIRIVAITLLVAMCVTLILPVFVRADSRDDYNAAQAELDKANKELNSIKNTKKKQEAEKKSAQGRIGLIKTQIAALEAQINDTSERLTQKQQELDAKKLDFYKTEELFKERLKAMYIKRTSGTVSTVLAVNSYADFLTASVNLTKVAEADTNLLKKLDEEKRAIEEVEAQIQAELAVLEQQKADQEKKYGEVAGLLQVINSNLTDTQALEEAAKDNQKAKYDAYVAAKAATEKEYGISGGVGDFVGGEWQWPVPSSRNVTSPFGNRQSPIGSGTEYHTGVDIGASSGQAIVASNSGVVTVARYTSTGYGNYVIIDHGGDQKTLYGHCSSLSVTEGQEVSQGQTIAAIGRSGYATGNHLHFEIRIGGRQVDPYPYIQGH